MRNIKNGKYLPGDGAPESDPVKNDEQNNIAFYWTCSPNGLVELERHRLLAVRAVKTSNLMRSSMYIMVMPMIRSQIL